VKVPSRCALRSAPPNAIRLALLRSPVTSASAASVGVSVLCTLATLPFTRRSRGPEQARPARCGSHHTRSPTRVVDTPGPTRSMVPAPSLWGMMRGYGIPYPCRWDRRSPRRADAFHLAGRRSSRLLDSDPQCLVTRKFCQLLPLAESRTFCLAQPDAGRMRCPTETLGEGKGERTAGKGRETATVEESPSTRGTSGFRSRRRRTTPGGRCPTTP
jgi:hypothetical protein